MEENKPLLDLIDFILNIPNQDEIQISINTQKLRNEFDFNSFEDNDIFYTKVLSHLLKDDEEEKIINNFLSSSKIFQRNLFAFLEYLRTLITKYQHKDIYKEAIVKLDLSLIIGYLVNKYGAEIVESLEFFPSCIKELEKKYNKNIIKETIYDIELKKDAAVILNTLKKRKRKNFKNLLLFFQNQESKIENFTQNDMDIIDEISIKTKNLSLNEINNDYINNKSFEKYLNIYLEKKLAINGYDKKNYEKGKDKELYEQKKIQMKNNLFYSEILKVDINNIDDCIYLLYFYSNLKKDTPFYDIDKEFKQLLSRKEISDFSDNLRKIVEDESFIQDLKKILDQKSVKDYFEKARRFTNEEEDNYEMEFIEEEKVKDEDDFLKDGFVRLMSLINGDKYFFSKLFIFKYLPKYRRAFVDPNMRIVINPIYFELSESLDDKKRNEIFRAYLFIIIIHEIAHLVKFMKEKNISYSNIPQTPKNKEGGKMFINYLFNTPMICSINYKQASTINIPENWNKKELLSNIFKEQKEWYEKNKKDKNEDMTLPKGEDSISFYLSLVNDDNNEKNSKNIIDIWYDID